MQGQQEQTTEAFRFAPDQVRDQASRWRMISEPLIDYYELDGEARDKDSEKEAKQSQNACKRARLMQYARSRRRRSSCFMDSATPVLVNGLH
eukprot:888425-Pelagomonas_calceolata.AAC.10